MICAFSFVVTLIHAAAPESDVPNQFQLEPLGADLVEHHLLSSDHPSGLLFDVDLRSNLPNLTEEGNASLEPLPFSDTDLTIDLADHREKNPISRGHRQRAAKYIDEIYPIVKRPLSVFRSLQPKVTIEEEDEAHEDDDDGVNLAAENEALYSNFASSTFRILKGFYNSGYFIFDSYAINEATSDVKENDAEPFRSKLYSTDDSESITDVAPLLLGEDNEQAVHVYPKDSADQTVMLEKFGEFSFFSSVDDLSMNHIPNDAPLAESPSVEVLFENYHHNDGSRSYEDDYEITSQEELFTVDSSKSFLKFDQEVEEPNDTDDVLISQFDKQAWVESGDTDLYDASEKEYSAADDVILLSLSVEMPSVAQSDSDSDENTPFKSSIVFSSSLKNTGSTAMIPSSEYSVNDRDEDDDYTEQKQIFESLNVRLPACGDADSDASTLSGLELFLTSLRGCRSSSPSSSLSSSSSSQWTAVPSHFRSDSDSLLSVPKILSERDLNLHPAPFTSSLPLRGSRGTTHYLRGSLPSLYKLPSDSNSDLSDGTATHTASYLMVPPSITYRSLLSPSLHRGYSSHPVPLSLSLTPPKRTPHTPPSYPSTQQNNHRKLQETAAYVTDSTDAVNDMRKETDETDRTFSFLFSGVFHANSRKTVIIGTEKEETGY